MPVVPIFVEFLAALRDSQVVIIAPGSSNVKEIGPTFSGSYAFAIDALHSFFVVVVRHSISFCVFVSEK